MVESIPDYSMNKPTLSHTEAGIWNVRLVRSHLGVGMLPHLTSYCIRLSAA